MSDSKDYFFEDLLSQTNDLLKDLEGLDKTDLPDEEFAETVSDETHENFTKSDFEGQDYRVDGAVEINLSKDEMNAVADFLPPSEGMAPITFEDVSQILFEKGIVFGVNNDLIKESIFECNTEFKIVKNVIVATGKQPVKNVPQHCIVDDQLIGNNDEKLSSVTRIDFKKRSPFKIVKEGQFLAKVVPEKQGEFGWTVRGEELQYVTQNVKSYKPGKNTITYEDHVASACDGTFEIQGNGFCVKEVLQIQSDVNYSTGNVQFPGDIIINGQIQDGFEVTSGGSIYISGTLDATVIECKDDLIVGLGIIGRNKGKVRVGGKLKAKFIENCYVEVLNLIMLDAGIMNAQIYTNDKIVLGKRGVIVGGSIYAQNGVVATQMGTAMGPRTEIYCGVDFTVENKLKWIRDNSLKVATKLNQVREQLKKDRNENPQLIELRDKLQSSLRQLNDMSSTLVFKLDKNDNAEILVRDTVYPGVYIEICHVPYVVNREMSSVRFKLDKENGKIKVERL